MMIRALNTEDAHPADSRLVHPRQFFPQVPVRLVATCSARQTDFRHMQERESIGSFLGLLANESSSSIA